MNGRIEERAGLVDFNHPASLHDRDFVAVMGGNAKIGGYDQLRRPGFARQFFHQIEDLALNDQLGALKVQVKDAWPNLFRQARFLSAVDTVQADRFRRRVAQEMARIFQRVDLLLVPSLRDEQLTITNFTGHPSLTLRAGFVEVSEARSDWAPDLAHPLPRFSPPRRCGRCSSGR